MKLKDIIYESERFTRHEEYLKKHAEKTKKASSIAGRDDVAYEDDHTYNDYQGLKWVDVKKHDDVTITSAIVDGILDSMRTSLDEMGIKQDDYYDRLRGMYEEYRSLDDLLDIIRENENEEMYGFVMNFLHKHMHGMTTVYRGFKFTKAEYDKMTKGDDMRREHNILKYLSNRSKKFNSFSTAIKVSAEFANIGRDNYTYVIAAEVEPNDINYAFTAYLMGRHDGVGECELNINNLKDLKNLRVVNIKEELKRDFENISVENLNRRLAKEGLKIFDRYKEMDEDIPGIGRCIIAQINAYNVLIKDNKIISPLSATAIEPVRKYEKLIYFGDDVSRPLEFRLYKIGYGFLGKKHYKDIMDGPYGYFICIDKNNKYYLIDSNTGNSLFKGGLENIEVVKDRTMRTKWPNTWIKVKTPSEKETIMDVKTHNVVFTGNIKMFDKIMTNSRAINTVFCKANGQEFTYTLQDNKLILNVG